LPHSWIAYDPSGWCLELDTIISQKNVYYPSFADQNQPFTILAGFGLYFSNLVKTSVDQPFTKRKRKALKNQYFHWTISGPLSAK